MAASSSGAFIKGLFPEVRAMVDALPAAEQETFSYLASVDHQNHHQQQQHKKHGNASKGKSSGNSNEAHEHRCNCFGCYTKHWELWEKSKYSEEITNALIRYETLLAQEQGNSGRRNPWHVGGKKESSSKEKLKRGNKEKNGCLDSSSNHKGKAKNRGGKESKDAGTPPASASSAVVPKEHDEGEGAAVAPAVDTVPKEEKSSHDKKSMKKQQQKDGEAKSEQQQPQPQPPVSKPRSKQVAPLDFKEDLAAEESVEESIAESSLGACKPQQSFGNRASETLGFVCDKLLGMWYPRLRRRN